jgi:hypothetical protein
MVVAGQKPQNHLCEGAAQAAFYLAKKSRCHRLHSFLGNKNPGAYKKNFSKAKVA